MPEYHPDHDDKTHIVYEECECTEWREQLDAVTIERDDLLSKLYLYQLTYGSILPEDTVYDPVPAVHGADVVFIDETYYPNEGADYTPLIYDDVVYSESFYPEIPEIYSTNEEDPKFGPHDPHSGFNRDHDDYYVADEFLYYFDDDSYSPESFYKTGDHGPFDYYDYVLNSYDGPDYYSHDYHGDYDLGYDPYDSHHGHHGGHGDHHGAH